MTINTFSEPGYVSQAGTRINTSVAVVVGPAGDAADPAQVTAAIEAALDSDPTLVSEPVEAAIMAHEAKARPHPAAESGKDFAGWFTAQIA